MDETMIVRKKKDALPASLEHVEDILIMKRRNSENFYDVLAKIDGELHGFEYMAPTTAWNIKTKVDDLISAIEHEVDVFDPLHAGNPLEESFAPNTINAALVLSPEEMPEDGEGRFSVMGRAHLQAVADFLQDHVDPELIEVLRYFRAGWRGTDLPLFILPTSRDTTEVGLLAEYDMFELLNSPRDGRRARAMREAPLLARDIIIDKNTLQPLIDRGASRAELMPAIAERLGTQEPARLKAFLSLQSQFLKQSEGGNFWRDLGTSIGDEELIPSEDKESHEPFTNARRMLRLVAAAFRELPLPLLRGGPETLPALTALVYEKDALYRVHGIEDIQIDPILRKYSLEDLPEACHTLRRIHFFPSLDGLSDYRRFLNHKSLAIAISRKLRAIENVDLDELHATARKILGDEEVGPGEAERLSGAIDILSRMPSWTYGVHPQRAINELVAESTSIKTLAELNTRWHHNARRLEDLALTGSIETEWEPLVGDIARGEIFMRELHSSRSLREQGHKERHCVGSYTSTVLSGRRDNFNVIFSIERGDEILSTLQVRGAVTTDADKSEISFEQGQHFAQGNTEPCPAAIAAAGKLMAHLETLHPQAVATYTERLTASSERLRDSLSKLLNDWGANILDPKLEDILAPEMKAVLPKRMRDLAYLQGDDFEISLPEAELSALFEPSEEFDPLP